MKVAVKKMWNGTCRWPQVKPAKSKRGFGIEAARVTVIKVYFLTCLKSFTFNLSMVSFGSLFSFSSTSSNSSLLFPAMLAAKAKK